MGALDDLLSAWRTNPDADSTIALCSYLGGGGRETLVREVGSNAETWHARNVDVMLSVGRMYLDSNLLPEAQAALVTAGKANGADPRPFRFLGEVLLRRGDAMRAEKVLARAIQLGSGDPDVSHWHDRASFYIALQKRVGAQAVAEEVLRALPRKVSIPAPMVSPQPFAGEDVTTRARVAARALQPSPLPRFASQDSFDEISQVEEIPSVGSIPEPPTQPVVRRAQRAPTLIGVAPPKIATTPTSSRRSPQVVMPSKSASSAALAGPAELFEPEVVTGITAAPMPAAKPQPKPSTPPPPPPKPSTPPPPKPPVAAYGFAEKALPDTIPAPPLAGNGMSPVAPFALHSPGAVPAATGFVPVTPAPLPRPEPAADSSALTWRYSDNNPAAGVVLEHLALVGLFEPQGGARPAWEAPAKQKSRGLWAWSLAIVVLLGGGAGGYVYAKDVKEKKTARAAVLSGEVDKLLRSGKVADLRATDQKLSEAFELDSLSQQAARLWLQNRVLRALMLSDEPRGIDSAVHRGKTVGLTDKEVAVGRVASFLAEGDVAGAAAVLTRWDKDAARDAYYQLAAGAVLERAGDLRAIERYEAARTLAPDLAATEIALARLALVEFGKQRATPVIDSLKRRTGEQPATRGLAALAWAVDRDRPETVPPEAALQPSDIKELPAPLSAVPAMVDAVRAIQAGDVAKASVAIDSAIDRSDTPSLAVTLGFFAIEIGDERLARKAALRALAFSALYPRARILAARVALLGGRLEEAQKAVEELEPTSPDVAVVRAAVAYEALEPGDLDGALGALGAAADDPALTALRVAADIQRGTAYPKAEDLVGMAHPSVPWGELVATDAALDLGDLPSAERSLSLRPTGEQRAVHALRVARLRRLQGKLDQALEASAKALEGNVTPSLLLERSYELIAADRAADARAFVAKYPSVLGPLTSWLQAIIEVAAKQDAQAQARVAKLELPPEATPLALRVMVAKALVATADKRAKPYLDALAERSAKYPELAALAAPKK
jgi:tetratricopeptide (TPR) repeat protein